VSKQNKKLNGILKHVLHRKKKKLM